MAIVEDLLATEDDFAWLKRPDFIWRDGPDDEVRIRSDSFCLNGSPTLNRFLQQWHIDLLKLALHKRCLTTIGSESDVMIYVISRRITSAPMLSPCADSGESDLT